MPDTRLRLLERRYLATQALEDEANYLRERRRQRDLSVEELRTAAYCGHEAARLALGEEAPESPQDPAEWVLGLRERGGAPWVKALLAISGLRFNGSHTRQRRAGRQALAALSSWARGIERPHELQEACAALERRTREPPNLVGRLLHEACLELTGQPPPRHPRDAPLEQLLKTDSRLAPRVRSLLEREVSLHAPRVALPTLILEARPRSLRPTGEVAEQTACGVGCGGVLALFAVATFHASYVNLQAGDLVQPILAGLTGVVAVLFLMAGAAGLFCEWRERREQAAADRACLATPGATGAAPSSGSESWPAGGDQPARAS